MVIGHTPSSGEFQRIIASAESMWSTAEGGYTTAREYYEGEQKPSGADSNLYITKDLITDYVNRQVSKLVAGEIEPSFVGGDDMIDAGKQLVMKMLEYNKFKEALIEYFGNLFEVEGLAGLKFAFNQFEISDFGLGTPKIYVLRPGEILLDPNNTNPFNMDEDILRIMKTRMSLDEAKQRWYMKKDELNVLSEESNSDETEMWVDVYEIEWKVMTYFPAAHQDDPQYKNAPEAKLPDLIRNKYTGNGKYKILDMEILQRQEVELQIQVPIFFNSVVVGQTVIVENPKPTGYSGFTIIPAHHTMRLSTNKYPHSNVPLLKDSQDMINMLFSILTEVAKAAPKIVPFITGATDDEIARAKKEIGKPKGLVYFTNPTARVVFPPTPELPNSIVQFLDMQLAILDRIGADYSPSRGEVEGDISGRAIAFLQSRDDLTQYVQKKHIEHSFVELFRRMFECAVSKMSEPFSIYSEIDGQERKIFFNTPADDAEYQQYLGSVEDEDEKSSEDNLHTFTEGLINNLSRMKVPEIKVDVQLNVFQKKAEEIEKAQLALNSQMLAPIDYHKAMYPDRYQEIHENWVEFNSANQILQTLIDTFGDNIVNALPDILRITREYTVAANQGAANQQGATPQPANLGPDNGEPQPEQGGGVRY